MCATDRPNQRFKLYPYQNHLMNDVSVTHEQWLLNSDYTARVDGSAILLRTPITFVKTDLSSVSKQIECAVQCPEFTTASFPGKKEIQCMQNETITTKQAMKCWRSVYFVFILHYFQLGIFQYLVGLELCIDIHVHVFMYLFTAGYAVSYELGGGGNQSSSWLYTTAVTLTQSLVLSGWTSQVEHSFSFWRKKKKIQRIWGCLMNAQVNNNSVIIFFFLVAEMCS